MSHHFSTLPSGQILLHVSNLKSEVIISLFGGHVLSWVPKGSEEVFYLSKNAFFDNKSAIRGGIPLCWPWFGNKENSNAHGFVRTMTWSVLSIDEIDVDHTIISLLPENLPYELCDIKLILTISISDHFSVSLKTINESGTPFTFTQALHTYFKISDIDNIKISGLKGTSYFDKLLGSTQFDDDNEIIFDQEVDKIYASANVVSLVDQNRTIVVDSHGATDTVIWNPWKVKNDSLKDLYPDAYKGFVCIENGNILNSIQLNPSDQHEIIQKIHIQ